MMMQCQNDEIWEGRNDGKGWEEVTKLRAENEKLRLVIEETSKVLKSA